MGFRSLAVVAALVASQIALVSACGWANEGCCDLDIGPGTCKVGGLECVDTRCVPSPGCGGEGQECCDIPDNNPNMGTCSDPNNLVCWEGLCGKCGMNGKMACPGSRCVDDCLEVNKDGWCSEIPNCRPFEWQGCEPACGAGQVCKWDRCLECGGLYETPCEGGCDGLLAVRESDGVCAHPPAEKFCTKKKLKKTFINAVDLPGSGDVLQDFSWCKKMCKKKQAEGCNAVVWEKEWKKCYLKKVDMNNVDIEERKGFTSFVFC